MEDLSLGVTPSFRGTQTFPHITELSLSPNLTNPRTSFIPILDALERLPGLVKVHFLFQEDWFSEIHSRNLITLPSVQEMVLCAADISGGLRPSVIPPILRFLKLPKATSLVMSSVFPISLDTSILPVTSFSEHLPNYVELPELRIDTTASRGEIVFRSASQATFTYVTGLLCDYGRERRLWGGLPLSSIRKVTAVLVDPTLGNEDAWLVDVLGEVGSLELLELAGDCGHVLWHLHHRVAQGMLWVDIKALTVRGGEYARTQALKFESTRDDLGLQNMTVTYILDPEVHEGLPQDPDAESLGGDEVWVWNED